MHRRPGLLLVPVLALGLLAPAAASAAPGHTAHNGPSGRNHEAVCAPQPAGYASCDAKVVTNGKGAPLATAGPRGYWPADLQRAYSLPSATAGTGQTIAIVDAYDAPSAESDLAVYRSQFGLSPCTTANGCFRKVNQNGGTSYPKRNAGWAQETSLDLDMASAICPKCKILLVEATNNSLVNLGTAVNRAALMGANTISNSYGSLEFSSEATYEQSYYNHPGAAITVSSGDSGYGAEFPASSRYVTAVGGTTLSYDVAAQARVSETAWSGAGSGCSRYITKPAWQSDAGCSRRTVADVSAVANPATGVAVYDSYPYQGTSGWMVFGGTSVSAPIIAGVYALAGNSSSLSYGSYPYSHSGSLLDITSGSNGSSCGSYLCTAGSGYDGPTGLGVPAGSGAF
jgi:subtilase family serine protease